MEPRDNGSERGDQSAYGEEVAPNPHLPDSVRSEQARHAAAEEDQERRRAAAKVAHPKSAPKLQQQADADPDDDDDEVDENEARNGQVSRNSSRRGSKGKEGNDQQEQAQPQSQGRINERSSYDAAYEYQIFLAVSQILGLISIPLYYALGGLIEGTTLIVMKGVMIPAATICVDIKDRIELRNTVTTDEVRAELQRRWEQRREDWSGFAHRFSRAFGTTIGHAVACLSLSDFPVGLNEAYNQYGLDYMQAGPVGVRTLFASISQEHRAEGKLTDAQRAAAATAGQQAAPPPRPAGR